MLRLEVDPSQIPLASCVSSDEIGALAWSELNVGDSAPAAVSGRSSGPDGTGLQVDAEVAASDPSEVARLLAGSGLGLGSAAHRAAALSGGDSFDVDSAMLAVPQNGPADRPADRGDAGPDLVPGSLARALGEPLACGGVTTVGAVDGSEDREPVRSGSQDRLWDPVEPRHAPEMKASVGPEPILVICGHCHKTLSVRGELAGQLGLCPACGSMLLIPYADGSLPTLGKATRDTYRYQRRHGTPAEDGIHLRLRRRTAGSDGTQAGQVRQSSGLPAATQAVQRGGLATLSEHSGAVAGGVSSLAMAPTAASSVQAVEPSPAGASATGGDGWVKLLLVGVVVVLSAGVGWFVWDRWQIRSAGEPGGAVAAVDVRSGPGGGAGGGAGARVSATGSVDNGTDGLPWMPTMPQASPGTPSGWAGAPAVPSPTPARILAEQVLPTPTTAAVTRPTPVPEPAARPTLRMTATGLRPVFFAVRMLEPARPGERYVLVDVELAGLVAHPQRVELTGESGVGLEVGGRRFVCMGRRLADADYNPFGGTGFFDVRPVVVDRESGPVIATLVFLLPTGAGGVGRLVHTSAAGAEIDVGSALRADVTGGRTVAGRWKKDGLARQLTSYPEAVLEAMKGYEQEMVVVDEGGSLRVEVVGTGVSGSLSIDDARGLAGEFAGSFGGGGQTARASVRLVDGGERLLVQFSEQLGYTLVFNRMNP